MTAQRCVQMEREHREEVERLERQLVAERAAATEASRDAAAFAQDLAQVEPQLNTEGSSLVLYYGVQPPRKAVELISPQLEPREALHKAETGCMNP